MRLENTTAIVTGGASGLGRAAAGALAGAGAKVAILDFNAELAAKAAAEIGGLAVEVDVADEASVEAGVAQATKELGAARVVVNCAGIGSAARIVGREGKLSTELFARVIAVNLVGTYYVMSHAVRDMVALEPLEDGQRGVVVNTASAAYQDGQLGQAAYASSKGGVASLCLPAARELAQHGVRVCAIAPGLFDTPMMEGLPAETVAGITANVPFPHRLGRPEEFGALARHIVENDYLNGEVVRLDGATRLPPR